MSMSGRPATTRRKATRRRGGPRFSIRSRRPATVLRQTAWGEECDLRLPMLPGGENQARAPKHVRGRNRPGRIRRGRDFLKTRLEPSDRGEAPQIAALYREVGLNPDAQSEFLRRLSPDQGTRIGMEFAPRPPFPLSVPNTDRLPGLMDVRLMPPLQLLVSTASGFPAAFSRKSAFFLTPGSVPGSSPRGRKSPA